MEAKHTRGDWSGATHTMDAVGRTIACNIGGEAWKDKNGTFEGEVRANARLIAAAPEMLEALHDLLTERDKYGGCPPSSPAWDIARAVIAKATT